MQITYKEASKLVPLVFKLKNEGLKPLSTIRVVRLIKSLKAANEDRQEAIKIILKQYDIQPKRVPGKGMVSTYEGHDQQKEIQDSIDTIEAQVAEVSPVKFLSEEELVACSLGMDISLVAALAEYLVDESLPTIDQPKERSRILQPSR